MSPPKAPPSSPTWFQELVSDGKLMSILEQQDKHRKATAPSVEDMVEFLGMADTVLVLLHCSGRVYSLLPEARKAINDVAKAISDRPWMSGVFVCFDTQLFNQVNFTSDDVIQKFAQVEIAARGGTSWQPVLKAMSTHSPDRALIVSEGRFQEGYITSLCTKNMLYYPIGSRYK